ncbi:hypothetical protein CMV05_18110 [Vibrio anguillarum]|nr:hypothetical protein CMV05_18110 [Vibrio anguillarum]
MLRSSLFFQIAQFEFFCFFADSAFWFINESVSLFQVYKKARSLYAPHNPTGRFNFSVRRSKAEES